MQIGTIIAIYFVLWWVCLFVILPIGARSQHEAGDVFPGSEPGAPALFRFWPKIIATSLLAAVVQVVMMWVLANPILQQYWT